MITVNQWTVSLQGLTGRARLANGTLVKRLPQQCLWDRDMHWGVPVGTPLQVEYAYLVRSGCGWCWLNTSWPACFDLATE